MSANRLPKPRFLERCNRCGYCCSVQPCALAIEHLKCQVGPCVALETYPSGGTACGLVRNPLAYLFNVAHPNANIRPPDPAIDTPDAHQLSVSFAAALGLGAGCDAADDEVSARWNA